MRRTESEKLLFKAELAATFPTLSNLKVLEWDCHDVPPWLTNNHVNPRTDVMISSNIAKSVSRARSADIRTNHVIQRPDKGFVLCRSSHPGHREVIVTGSPVKVYKVGAQN
jgi:hypothetical protein